jgi:hypothetical protein
MFFQKKKGMEREKRRKEPQLQHDIIIGLHVMTGIN